MKLKSNFKRILSGVMSLAMAATLLPSLPVVAVEATEKYPYTMFAASDTEGSITINANNFCVNGNIATNGTIVSSGNMNVNGTKTENADEEMIYILKKLNYSYFSGDNVETYADDYSFEDLNININNPMDVNGTLELTGNINLNSGIKAVEDVTINGEVKNTNNSVICSETGDINIETSNVNFSGLIYAPYGDINIDTDNLNLNNVIIIGQTITIDCPSINANYSNSMAELVGTTSDIEVDLSVFGGYNSETNSMNLTWYTNYTNSSYEIWSSDDNMNYLSEAIVENGVYTYQHPITEDFETKYFKVSLTTNYGEVVYSNSVKVVKSENGYVVTFTDTDGDGLSDLLEKEYGTNINKVDTDDDGLTDYQEIYITGTNPTKYDSVTEGVSDADADSDSDGLTNAQEIELGTDPRNDDTDNDGLSDYDEINIYGTDPLIPDTDGDGLKDGDEPHIGLDPTNPETFDVPDAEHVSNQTIAENSEALKEINTDDNPYKMSIEIESTGYVEGNLNARETSYSNAIKNDAILGIAPELTCDNSCNISKVVLKFNIADEFVDNELNLFPDEPDLQGLKRLTIFKYFEDMNMLLPIETKYDLENNTIYTEVDELGTYCIMDMEKWLANLGISINEDEPMLMSFEAEAVEDIAAEFNEESTRVEFSEETLAEINDEEDTLTEETFAPAMFAAAQTRGAVTVQTPVDIAFLIQTSGQLEDTFNSQCKMIGNLMDSLIAQYGNGNVRFCLITYNLNGAQALKFTSDGNIWFTNSMAVKMALSAQQYVYTSGYTDRGNAFKLLQNNVTFKETSAKFIFQVMNGSTNVGSMYFDQINTCAKLGINYSELMPAGYSYIDPSYGQQVDNAIKSNGGLNLTYGTNSESSVYNHIVENVAPPHVEFKAVLPTCWETISLVNVLDPNNGAKSDNDDLTDWEEVDTESGLITWDNYGNIQLPTFEQCLNKVHDQGFSYVLNEYSDSIPSYMHRYFYGVEILPIKSNPCEEDSDGDGLDDFIDEQPLIYNHIDEYAGLQYPDTLIDDEEIASEIQNLYKQKYEINIQNAKGKISNSDYKTLSDLYDCNIDSARANYILSGFNNNPNSDYNTNSQQQEFNSYFLSDESTSKPFINFSKFITYGDSSTENRVALIVVQKVLELKDIYISPKYGTYDDDTLNAVLEAKESLSFGITGDDAGDITYDFVAPLIMSYTENNNGEIENWFYKFIQEMTYYHNSVKHYTYVRLKIDNPTGDFSKEVTIKGGGVLTKATNGAKVTPGFADILGRFDEKSMVWEVKRSASYDQGRRQITRYIDATKKYEQSFKLPLESGNKINAFAYYDIASQKYIAVYADKRGTKSNNGSGVVLYHEYNSKEEAVSLAKQYGYAYDDVCEYVPQTIPEGALVVDFDIAYSFNFGMNSVPMQTQQVVVIEGVLYAVVFIFGMLCLVAV